MDSFIGRLSTHSFREITRIEVDGSPPTDDWEIGSFYPFVDRFLLVVCHGGTVGDVNVQVRALLVTGRVDCEVFRCAGDHNFRSIIRGFRGCWKTQ